MNCELDAEIEVTHLEGTPLYELFDNADLWREIEGELHLSDGRRYAYTLRSI